jgi:photosystem II stability/assembly factor-like uncharacterized protein
MLDQESGWAIGDTGAAVESILRTADGGGTWREVTPAEALSHPEQGTQALGYFQGKDRAWVVYFTPPGSTPEPAVVWRTQDGGQTWQSSQALDLSGLESIFDPSHLQLADDRVGWMLVHVGVGMNHDYVAFFKSTDGGQSWNRLLDPYNDGGIQSCYKHDLLFTDAQHGWLTGTCNGVAAGVLLFRTADGGVSWQEVKLPAPASSPNLFTSFEVACGSSSPAFLDTQTGYIDVSCDLYTQEPRTTEHYLFFTDDGGDTWTSTPYPGGELRFFDVQTGLALGQEIFKTEDGGASWTKISVVTWEGLFDFPAEGYGWAIARSGDKIALVFSQDGGQYWTIVQPRLAP